MENFFNVLIVVITLIAFIISAISKSNKKKSTARQGAQQDNFFESIFENGQESDYNPSEVAEEKFQSEPEIEAVSEEKEENNAQDKPLEYYNGDESQSAFAIDADNDIYSHEIKDEIQESNYDYKINEVLEDFELSDAIIYSEILNRKNY